MKASLTTIYSLLFLVLLFLQCSEKNQTAEQKLAQEGRLIYITQCASCHNVDPAVDGNLGPAVSGSSFKLLKLKILEGKYPAAYKPKRDTKMMVPLKLTVEDVKKVAAFLK